MKKEEKTYNIKIKKRVGEIGQSLRITIPAAVVKELNLNDKEELLLSIDNKRIVINKIT